jgi:hypothetical protein
MTRDFKNLYLCDLSIKYKRILDQSQGNPALRFNLVFEHVIKFLWFLTADSIGKPRIVS